MATVYCSPEKVITITLTRNEEEEYRNNNNNSHHNNNVKDTNIYAYDGKGEILKHFQSTHSTATHLQHIHSCGNGVIHE